MKKLRYVGYFLVGMIWLFFGGVPVFPFGVFAVTGAWKDSRKAIATGLIVLGMALGFFGIGLYLRIMPEGKMVNVSIAPGIQCDLKAIQRYRNNLEFVWSGAITRGRIVANEGLDCLMRSDVLCFENLFDETFVGATKQDLNKELNQLLAQTGAMKANQLVDIRLQKLPDEKGKIFQFFYAIKTEKTPDFMLILSGCKRGQAWKLVGFNVAPVNANS